MISNRNVIQFNVSKLCCRAEWQRYTDLDVSTRIQVIHSAVTLVLAYILYICMYMCICGNFREQCGLLCVCIKYQISWNTSSAYSKCNFYAPFVLMCFSGCLCWWPYVGIMAQARWRWGLRSVCAAPEIHQSKPLGGHVPGNAEHSESLLPHILTPDSGGRLAVNRKHSLVLSANRAERHHHSVSTLLFQMVSVFCQSMQSKQYTAIQTWAHTHSPAGSQHASTHSIVLANELEDRDLVVFRELVLWGVLCHCFIRDTPG